MAHFAMYKDSKGEWRWRLSAGNNKIVADSGEGYNNRSDCRNAIGIVKREAPTATVLEKDTSGKWQVVPAGG